MTGAPTALYNSPPTHDAAAADANLGFKATCAAAEEACRQPTVSATCVVTRLPTARTNRGLRDHRGNTNHHAADGDELVNV